MNTVYAPRIWRLRPRVLIIQTDDKGLRTRACRSVGGASEEERGRNDRKDKWMQAGRQGGRRRATARPATRIGDSDGRAPDDSDGDLAHLVREPAGPRRAQPRVTRAPPPHAVAVTR